MEIQLEDGSGDVIAHEIIDGAMYGEFFVSVDGQVCYRYSGNERSCNRNREAFERSVAAWRRYRVNVCRVATEPEQLAVVAGFRENLRHDPRALNDPESFWSVILEQAEQGLL